LIAILSSEPFINLSAAALWNQSERRHDLRRMRHKFFGTGEEGYSPLRKLKVWLSGLRYAIFYDFSVAYKVVLSVIVLSVCFYFRQWIDFLLVMVTTGLMLIVEMLNTTIEALCDFVEDRENFKIKVIKDIAAAAAGISILMWLVVFLTEVSRIWYLIYPD
jgi:diacylglycerol kinase